MISGAQGSSAAAGGICSRERLRTLVISVLVGVEQLVHKLRLNARILVSAARQTYLRSSECIAMPALAL